MCFSAMVWANYHSYVKLYGAVISIQEFVMLFKLRLEGAKVAIPKGMSDAFSTPTSPEEQQVKALIDAYNEQESKRLEEELFKLRKRLADAERKLATKPTKQALEHQRIANSKIAACLGRLADLRRTEPKEKDSRIYPGYYCPVMVMENGRLVIKPMRYQCRPCGKPASYDTKYPGTYNARRDNLEGFWKGQFGSTHALIVATAFFENVSKHKLEGRELSQEEKPENVVLKFEPRTGEPMQVACLYSAWESEGEPNLLSFAAITDDPPPEVAAAGHDRCIVPIRSENVRSWLEPETRLDGSYSILDDREQPYYEHQLAA